MAPPLHYPPTKPLFTRADATLAIAQRPAFCITSPIFCSYLPDFLGAKARETFPAFFPRLLPNLVTVFSPGSSCGPRSEGARCARRRRTQRTADKTAAPRNSSRPPLDPLPGFFQAAPQSAPWILPNRLAGRSPCSCRPVSRPPPDRRAGDSSRPSPDRRAVQPPDRSRPGPSPARSLPARPFPGPIAPGPILPRPGHPRPGHPTALGFRTSVSARATPHPPRRGRPCGSRSSTP